MLRRTLCVVVGVFLSVAPAFGQGGVAEINGGAVDQTGSALPGATITIVDEATGLQRTSVANESGRFVIVAVTPGRYTVRAELPGFQTQTQTGILVQVGQAITLNLTLPIGGAHRPGHRHRRGADHRGDSDPDRHQYQRSGD